MSSQEELSLIRDCQNGNLASFSKLYDFYLDKIYRFVYYRVSHKETAEDLSSQTFLKALKAIGSADFSEKNFSAWIYKIAYNLIIDHYRSDKKEMELDKVLDLSAKENLLEEVDKNKKIELIKKAMTCLSPKQRDVVIMRVWDELSYKEISGISGDSEENCKVIFSRAVSKLKENLPIEYFVLLFALNILKN
jgi:RNA polymerase sigma-70 factor (ECF subfamily)